MRRLSAIGQLLLWTLRDFSREPAVLFWTLGFPIVMTLVLGQVSTRSGDWHASVALLVDDADMESARAWLKDAPLKDKITFKVMLPAQLPRALATGQVSLSLEKPWDERRRTFRMDPANKDAQLTYFRLKSVLAHERNESEPLTLPGSRYIDFLLPGLLAMGLVSSCLWGIGWNLVELRQKKLLRLMLASPLKPGTFFASLYLGRLITATVEISTLLLFAVFLFKVHVQGSYWALALLWVSGLAAFFGVAVLVGSRTARPAVGQGLINAVTMPMFLVSGVFFSLDNFSPMLQKLFRLFPPTLLVDATRQIMSAGAGLAEVAPTCLALGAMGALCFGLGYRFFKFY